MQLLTVKKKKKKKKVFTMCCWWWVNDCSVLTRKNHIRKQSSPEEKRCLFIHMLYSHTCSAAKQGCNHGVNIVGDQICWRGHKKNFLPF